MSRIRALDPRMAYIVLLLAIVFEYLLFRNYVLRELTWGYPQYHDQVWYLSSSYFIYEKLLHHDFQSIFWLFRHTPQGILLQLEGAFLFLFAGASRLNALTINFLYLLAAQVFLFLIVKTLTKRLSIPLLAVGLFLMLKSIFIDIGGMTDYRLEFSGFCLFAIVLGSAVRSRIFLSTRWSVISALLVSLLILHRFLYLVFVSGTITLFFIVLLCLWFLVRKERALCLLRLRNLMIFGLFTSVLTLPIFYLNKKIIFDYYYTNSLGPTKYIWAEHAGIRNLADNLLFYPRMLLFHHLGPVAMLLGILLIILMLLVILFRKPKNIPSSEIGYPYKEAFLFLFVSFIVPLIVLTFITSKNSGLANVLVSPAFWLFIVTFIYLSQSKEVGSSLFLKALSLFILLTGCGFYGYNFGRHPASFYEKQDRQQVVKMYEDIGTFCRDTGIDKPLLSYDSIADYLTAELLDILYYEKTGDYINAHAWNSIFSVSGDQVRQRLNSSDIILFNPNGFRGDENSALPFVRDIRKFKPLFEEKTKEMTKLGEYSIFGNDIQVYGKPRLNFSIEGVGGDWLLPEKTYLIIPSDVARKVSAVVVSGRSAPQYLKDPELVAENSGAESDTKIISRIIIDDRKYLIYCAWSDYKSTSEGPLRIRLKFKKYFIPKELHINQDTRRLVLWAPNERRALSDLRQVAYSSDSNYICGSYGDGLVGPSGITFVLVPGRNRVSRKLKLTLSVPLPGNSSLNSMPTEILLDGHVIAERSLKRGGNDLTIEIPDAFRTSNLLEVQIKPKFYFIPSESSDSKDDRKVSFIFNKAAITD